MPTRLTPETQRQTSEQVRDSPCVPSAVTPPLTPSWIQHLKGHPAPPSPCLWSFPSAFVVTTLRRLTEQLLCARHRVRAWRGSRRRWATSRRRTGTGRALTPSSADEGAGTLTQNQQDPHGEEDHGEDQAPDPQGLVVCQSSRVRGGRREGWGATPAPPPGAATPLTIMERVLVLLLLGSCKDNRPGGREDQGTPHPASQPCLPTEGFLGSRAPREPRAGTAHSPREDLATRRPHCIHTSPTGKDVRLAQPCVEADVWV